MKKWGALRKYLMEYFGFYSEEEQGPLPALPKKTEPADPLLTALGQFGFDVFAASMVSRLAFFLVFGHI